MAVVLLQSLQIKEEPSTLDLNVTEPNDPLLDFASQPSTNDLEIRDIRISLYSWVPACCCLVSSSQEMCGKIYPFFDSFQLLLDVNDGLTEHHENQPSKAQQTNVVFEPITTTKGEE
jgi:hypothetical protein